MLANLLSLWWEGEGIGVIFFVVSQGKFHVGVISIVIRQRAERPGVRIPARL